MPVDDALFAAFREDHAVLGRGFHDLSQSLRVRDIAAARAAADNVDTLAGAHIAFEERYFYPALVPLLGEDDVERLLREHQTGLSVIRQLMSARADEVWAEAQWLALLERSQEMEQHIAECGELFGAMGRISAAERDALHQHLLELRRQAPRWTDLAAGGSPEAMC
jgi:hypothetical protein